MSADHTAKRPPFLQEVTRIALFWLSFIVVMQRRGVTGLIYLLPLLVTVDSMRLIYVQTQANGWTGGVLLHALVVIILTAIPIAIATVSAMLTFGELWGIALGVLWLAWFLTASGRTNSKQSEKS